MLVRRVPAVMPAGGRGGGVGLGFVCVHVVAYMPP